MSWRPSSRRWPATNPGCGRFPSWRAASASSRRGSCALPTANGVEERRRPTGARSGRGSTRWPSWRPWSAISATRLASRRGIDPESGRVTLYFHFPDRAREVHTDAIAALRRETGVEVALNPYPHQVELERLARELIPAGLAVLKDASFLPELRAVRLEVAGEAADKAVEASQAEFRRRTGWELLVERRDEPGATVTLDAAEDGVLDQQRALQVAREVLTSKGLYRVGANSGARRLQLRFRFPAVALAQAVQEIQEVERRTGWKVVIDPHPHQQALELLAVECLPPGTRKLGSPSLRPVQREMVLRVAGLEGSADTERFERESGWRLVLEGRG
jgi:uncharacterized protein